MTLPDDGLTAAWRGAQQWRIVDTGFGTGLSFLSTWRAWLDDPQRPRMLHYLAIEAEPLATAAQLGAHARTPQPDSPASRASLASLTQQLAVSWPTISTGFHRLSFEGGQVLLTLCVGDHRSVLRELDFSADSVFLDGGPVLDATMARDATLVKAIARLCRRGARLVAPRGSAKLRRDLHSYGFATEPHPDSPSEDQPVYAQYNPPWVPKGKPRGAGVATSHAVVIGAGLAGSAVAASLARRGWQVRVLDAAAHPASGASGLPVGLLAPQTSPDDNLLSRLSRIGLRLTVQEARRYLQHGQDWAHSGAHDVVRDLWQPEAAWIKPGALVRAWLAQPGIQWQGNTSVSQVVRNGENGERWQVRDANKVLLAEADLVVVAAAQASAALLGGALRLQPVRGQISWGPMVPGHHLPAHPINGHGHLLAHIPLEGLLEGPLQSPLAWLCGATFSRDDTGLDERAADHAANLERLRVLAPALAAQLAPQFDDGSVRAWAGVRCASHDRRPLLGERAPGLWVSCAMGSRGLTFAALCAELLAARLHDEPQPLPRRLAQALDVGR